MKAYLWYFFAYAFIGWCAEVVFAALKNGHFVNRDFLNGPLCPIYGAGIVAVLACTQPFQGSLITLYVSSVVLTTALELVTGYAMEKLFHQRWWDYSKMPFNIGGYVCPLFSLIWGFACILIVDVIHPRIARILGLIAEPWSTVLLCVFGAVFVLDLCVTVATVTKLNKRLSQIDEVSAALRVLSDKLGTTMADGALSVQAADEKLRGELKAADEKARAELSSRYDELNARLAREQQRLLKAFPDIRSLRYPEALNQAKEKLSQLRESQRKPHQN